MPFQVYCYAMKASCLARTSHMSKHSANIKIFETLKYQLLFGNLNLVIRFSEKQDPT